MASSLFSSCSGSLAQVLVGTKQAEPDPIRNRYQAFRDKLLTAQSRISVVMLSSQQKALRLVVCVPASSALTQCQVSLEGEGLAERRAISRQ